MIDFETGSIKTTTKLTLKRFSERFILLRTTDGLALVNKLTGPEMKMLINLLAFEEHEKHEVSLSKKKFLELQKAVGLSRRQCNLVISQLEKKRALTPLTKTDFILNPVYFYQGNPREARARIKAFYAAYNEKHGTSFAGEEDLG